MAIKSTVVAAIATAVNLYIEAELQATAAEPVKTPGIPRPVYSPWVMAGRQEAMDLRRMWQMRLVR